MMIYIHNIPGYAVFYKLLEKSPLQIQISRLFYFVQNFFLR